MRGKMNIDLPNEMNQARAAVLRAENLLNKIRRARHASDTPFVDGEVSAHNRLALLVHDAIALIDCARCDLSI